MRKILFILIMFLEIFIIKNSNELIKEFTLTLNICMYSLMPSLFFQILFSNLLMNLLNNNKSVILLSIFSGYPNNIIFLKDKDNIYLNYFTNFVNPLFLFGTVKSIYLPNFKIILIIYISHFLSNIILLYMYKDKYIDSVFNITNNYSNSLKNTINSLSIIFSNLLFISLIITIIKMYIPFSCYIIGLIEFSRGIYEVSFLNINIIIKGLIILIIITFGSLSIHFQTISINPKIKYIKFLLYRLLNVFVSVFIYLILVLTMYKF